MKNAFNIVYPGEVRLRYDVNSVRLKSILNFRGFQCKWFFVSNTTSYYLLTIPRYTSCPDTFRTRGNDYVYLPASDIACFVPHSNTSGWAVIAGVGSPEVHSRWVVRDRDDASQSKYPAVLEIVPDDDVHESPYTCKE